MSHMKQYRREPARFRRHTRRAGIKEILDLAGLDSRATSPDSWTLLGWSHLVNGIPELPERRDNPSSGVANTNSNSRSGQACDSHVTIGRVFPNGIQTH
ncbi:hypothetical protein RRG08_007914 [Elysia crispata]|uniref:Uncharacterized protein n=1 Tax=Elysia crispata TaxID=231223 RepID=A0AAE0ZQ66_9GAST|nr:hypothetical protein RRG08_007914 [Elysia crispata]